MVLPAAAPANTRWEDLWVIVQLADQEGKKQKCRSQELREKERYQISHLKPVSQRPSLRAIDGLKQQLHILRKLALGVQVLV